MYYFQFSISFYVKTDNFLNVTIYTLSFTSNTNFNTKAWDLIFGLWLLNFWDLKSFCQFQEDLSRNYLLHDKKGIFFDKKKIRFLIKTNALKIIELNKADFYVHKTTEALRIQKLWIDWKYTVVKKGYFTKPLIKIKMKVLTINQDWTQKNLKNWDTLIFFKLRTRRKIIRGLEKLVQGLVFKKLYF